MGATTNLLLPYPDLTSTADGPDAFQKLGQGVEDYFYSRVLPAGVTRWGAFHWGSGTSFPTAGGGAKAGDTYFHTGLGCIMIFNGTAWRQLEETQVTTPALRTAISTNYSSLLHSGFRVYDTVTKILWEWDGSGNWAFKGWRGTDKTVAAGGGYPAAWCQWTNAVIANNTSTAVSSWTGVGGPPTSMSELFTYINTPGVAFRCNVKGRVKIQAYAASDNGFTGRSSLNLNLSVSRGIFGSVSDTSQRSTGYGGAGTLEQYIPEIIDVMPNDSLGMTIYSSTSNSGPVTYSNLLLQVAYIDS